MKKLIGVFATDISSRVQGKLYGKLQQQLSTKGYRLVFFSGELNRADFRTTDESAKKLFMMAEKIPFSAFFLHVESLQDKEMINYLIDLGNKKNIPVILYDCLNWGYTDADGVITVNLGYQKAFEDSVSHLIEHHGCKNIYMLAGTEGNQYSQERIDAYKKVMTNHGLDCSEDKIAYGGFWEMPAIEAINGLFKKLEEEKLPIPEAICCANDSMAIATVKLLRSKGYRIPEDIKITGFDNIEDGKFNSPSIATCEPVIDSIPDILLHAIEDDIRTGAYIVPLKFIPKESCGCRNSYAEEEKLEMSMIMANARQNIWQHSMLSNLELSLIDSCHIESLLGGLRETVKQFRGIALVYCIRDDLEQIEYYNSDYDNVRIRLNFDFYEEITDDAFSKDTIIPDFEDLLVNSDSDELYILQLLHSNRDDFGYSVMRTHSYATNEIRIFCQFAESFTNMLEGILRNIRLEQAKKKLNEMYERMSEIYIRDIMTGLYNRTGYYKELNDYLEQEEYASEYLHVFSIDMDGMKLINDNYGHQEGDNAIIAVAKAINECFAQPCICARFGGDEFVVSLFAKGPDEPSAEKISDRLNRFLSKSALLVDKEYTVGVSVGQSVAKVSEMVSVKELEKQADIEMYIDKRKRKKL